MSTDGSEHLVKASLARVEPFESVDVLWNPSRYRVERRRLIEAAAVIGGWTAPWRAAGGEERFETELFLDTTERAPGPDRDARHLVERLAAWMAPASAGAAPATVVFVWGPFRFAGAIEYIQEEWVRFDPDGTPVRAWLTLVLRR